jgi:hypothetical protein
VNVVMREEESQAQLIFGFALAPGGDLSNMVPSSRYRLKLRASARTSQPAERWFVVDGTDDAVLRFWPEDEPQE